MRILVTGGAGFIGSNLVRALCEDALFPVSEVVVVDNLSLGRKEFIEDLVDQGKVVFYGQDLLDREALQGVFDRHGFDLVWHLAANSDIGYGAKYTDWDLKQGTLATYNVLECMRRSGVKEIIFASTSAIYGEAEVFPTPENYGPLLPISFYGASKLACEGLITAFCHNYGFRAWIFRFANIVGRNGTHGALVDFIAKLRRDPKRLEVLGDGRQAKPYLHVMDCVGGMAYGYGKASKTVNVLNLACPGATTVTTIAETVISEVGGDAKIEYTGGVRGWTGDVPQVRLDTSVMENLGWKASKSSDEAVAMAVKELVAQSRMEYESSHTGRR